MNVDQRTDPTAMSNAGKAATAWLGVGLSKAGINTWSDVAAVLASIYTALLILGWLWRAWVRWRAGKALQPEEGKEP